MGVVLPNCDDVAGDDPISAILTVQDDDDASRMSVLTYELALGFLGVVLGSGPALLLSAPDGGVSRPSTVDGRWLRSAKSAPITLEPHRMLATVGLTDGDVEQFYVGVPPRDIGPVMR